MWSRSWSLRRSVAVAVLFLLPFGTPAEATAGGGSLHDNDAAASGTESTNDPLEWMSSKPKNLCPGCAPVYGMPGGVSAQSGGMAEPELSWVVVLYKREECSPEMLCGEGEALGSGKFNGVCYERYAKALNGMALTMDAANLAAFLEAALGCVQEVWRDATVTVQMSQRAPPWGLDRIDQRSLPLTNSYSYTADGTGVHAYVFDTGILETHQEFAYMDGRTGSRVKQTYSGFRDGDTTDCHGHGTHVAATLGGLTFGVAKNVTLHAVRVLDCQGNAQYSRVIKAFDDIAQNHESPAVAVLSLGGEPYSALDIAAQGLVDAGISVSVAAGNDNREACMQSPARVEAVITVAATSASDSIYMESNYGECVDLFAPGVNILSASHTSDIGTRYMTGTSMAVPFVAGAAALFLERNPSASPYVVAQTLVSSGVRNQISSTRGSPNILLSTNLLRPLLFSPTEFRITDASIGSEVTVSVTLPRRPAADVTVNLLSVPGRRADVSVSRLRFPRREWDTPQSFVLRLTEAAGEVRGVSFMLGFTLSSDDSEFDGIDAYYYVADDRQKLGESTEFPLDVSTLPFSDTRSTALFEHTYEEGCSEYRDSGDGPDIVYRYRPSNDEVIDVSLCGSEYDSKLYVFRDSAGEVYACNDDFAGCGYESRLRMRVSAGRTYYIVVDGFDGDFGLAKLNIARVEGVDPSRVPSGQLDLPPTGSDLPANDVSQPVDGSGPELTSLELLGCPLSPAFSPTHGSYNCVAPRGTREVTLSYRTAGTDAVVEFTHEPYYRFSAESGERRRSLKFDTDTQPLTKPPRYQSPLVSAQSSGFEQVGLQEGANLVSVTVRLPGGRQTVYTIIATAPSAARESYLQQLTFNAGGRSGPQLELSPAFRPDRFSYTLALSGSWENLWVEADPLSDNPRVEIAIDGQLPRYVMQDGTQATVYQLDPATPEVRVDVVAADGETSSTYQLALQRGGGGAGTSDGCEVGEWGEWTACSAPCGGGRRWRERLVTTSAAAAACPAAVEEETCNAEICSASAAMDANTTFVVSVAVSVALIICLAVGLLVFAVLRHRHLTARRAQGQAAASAAAAAAPSPSKHLPFLPLELATSSAPADHAPTYTANISYAMEASAMTTTCAEGRAQQPPTYSYYPASCDPVPTNMLPSQDPAAAAAQDPVGQGPQHRYTH